QKTATILNKQKFIVTVAIGYPSAPFLPGYQCYYDSIILEIVANPTVGRFNITPWPFDKLEIWTYANSANKDKEILQTLYKIGFLVPIPKNMPNTTQIFWSCFQLDESRKYAITNRYSAPSLTMPVIHRVQFSSESLIQFDQFFMHKDNISQSSYKTETLTDLLVFHTKFVLSWVLQENLKVNQKESVKRLTEQVKKLLGVMFHSGVMNSKLKINAAEMHAELLQHAHQRKIQQHDIPKISTIANWITKTSQTVKHNIALEFLEKNNMFKVQS
ncbi:2411_t:CDS:2, partial [Cetraspora pellucida]